MHESTNGHVRSKNGEGTVTAQNEQSVSQNNLDALEDELKNLDGDGDIGSDSPSKCAAPIDCID